MTTTHPLAFKEVPSFSTLMSTFPGITTFLFDMDGTLFDTEKYHTLAMQSIGEKYKIIPPLSPMEVHQLMMGKADHLVFDIVKDWPGFPKEWTAKEFVDEKNKNLLHILEKVDGAKYLSPKLLQMMNEAKASKINIGLVTSSEKVVTKELLRLSGLKEFFSYILTRDDSLRVKPDPWPYEKAMKHFECDPSETLIFEDSTVGITAASASGAHVVKAEWY